MNVLYMCYVKICGVYIFVFVGLVLKEMVEFVMVWLIVFFFNYIDIRELD